MDAWSVCLQLAADEGVHIVLGHHAHVLQPVEWMEGEEGNQTFVAYSLGNFLSGQDQLHRQIGGILTLTIVKRTEGAKEEILIEEPEFLLTYVTFEDETNYEVLPMKRVTNEDLPEIEEHYEEVKLHMQQWLPELKITDYEG